MSQLRLAIIVPRYGLDVAGGAETLARKFAETAVSHGCEVDVWTTCARDHTSWENVHERGQSTHQGVHIYRFPITQWPNEQHQQLMLQFGREYTLPVNRQFEWLFTWVHSEPMYEHIAAHAAHYDVVLALPYLSSIVYYAAWTAVEKVVLFPCLHDEPAAYLAPFRLLLESVQGILFLSPEEQMLATQQLGMNLPRHTVLGMGIDNPPEIPSHAVASEPFLLTMGRLEGGKNLQLIYDYVQRYVDEGNELKLVLVGQGDFKPPAHPAFEYRGFVTEREKQKLASSALALCHPSLNESFSIVIMESWLAGRPVMVHEQCAVTRGHVQRSGGGLTFVTYADFVNAISWLKAYPEKAVQMGENGRHYVQKNYTWPLVWERFSQFVQAQT